MVRAMEKLLSDPAKAAAEIERLTRELADARAEAVRLRSYNEGQAVITRQLETERDALRAEIGRLRTALEPFAYVPRDLPERRCIVVDAGDGPHHFLQSDLDRAKRTFRGDDEQEAPQSVKSEGTP